MAEGMGNVVKSSKEIEVQSIGTVGTDLHMSHQ